MPRILKNQFQDDEMCRGMEVFIGNRIYFFFEDRTESSPITTWYLKELVKKGELKELEVRDVL